MASDNEFPSSDSYFFNVKTQVTQPSQICLLQSLAFDSSLGGRISISCHGSPRYSHMKWNLLISEALSKPRWKGIYLSLPKNGSSSPLSFLTHILYHTSKLTRISFNPRKYFTYQGAPKAPNSNTFSVFLRSLSFHSFPPAFATISSI